MMCAIDGGNLKGRKIRFLLSRKKIALARKDQKLSHFMRIGKTITPNTQILIRK